MKHIGIYLLVGSFLFLFSCSVKRVYYPVNQKLFEEVLALDKKMFDAFNSGDFETVKSMHAVELEFFHDEAGLLTFEQHTGGIQNIISGETKVRRELVNGSSRVYPIRDYGAIQIGEHRFFNTPPGQGEQLMGTYKFTHIWHKTENGWQITRAISYGH